jgi:hypothetical protein
LPNKTSHHFKISLFKNFPWLIKKNVLVAPPKTYNIVKPYIGAIKKYVTPTNNYPLPLPLIGKKWSFFHWCGNLRVEGKLTRTV